PERSCSGRPRRLPGTGAKTSRRAGRRISAVWDPLARAVDARSCATLAGVWCAPMRGWRDRGKSGPDRRVLATRVRARVSRSELREGLEVRRQRGQSVPLTERIESELEGDEV